MLNRLVKTMIANTATSNMTQPDDCAFADETKTHWSPGKPVVAVTVKFDHVVSSIFIA